MKKLNLVRTIILAGSLLLQLSTLCFQSRGAAGDVDLSFDPGSGVNGPVNTVLVQPDGKVLIGGQFTTVKGLLRTNIARLNADGSGDATFNPVRAYNPVYALALQSDGKVLAGGQFLETCGDWGCSYPTAVIRLNVNGSLDNSFNPATAESSDYGDIRILVVQPDGKVLVGGDFYTVNGTNRMRIARLNASGDLDTSFNTGAGPNGPVSSITLQPDGKLFINGSFSMVNGTNRGGLARLNANGSLDLSFNAGTGTILYPDCGPGIECFDQTNATAVALQSNGQVLVGLWSRKYFVENEQEHLEDRYWMARLHADGSNDPSFVFTNQIALVGSILVQSDRKLLVCHGFSTSSSIKRLNANGTWDNSFNSGTESGGVDALALQPDGKVLIGGAFATVNGTNRNHVARLDTNGSLDLDFASDLGLGGPVSRLVLQPDGKVLIGGGRWFTQPVGVFTFLNGTNRYGSARLNANGSLDSTFISANNFNPNLAAFIHYEDCVDDPRFRCEQVAVPVAVLVQADGKVLIGGYVETTITGDEVFVQSFRHSLARFNADGSPDPSFEPESYSESQAVGALAVQPDGKVVVGGYFSSFKGTNRNGIARLHADGSLDSSFNPGTGAYGVASVALQPDGKVLIGGGFTAVNGTNRNGIARLNANGGLDVSFNPGTGANGNVSSIVVQSDGKVLIGGSFTTVNGTNRNRIARLNADGSLDTSFNPGTGANGNVSAIALQPDGNILIGGVFITVNGVVRPHVARLYGDSGATSLNIARSNAFVIVSWPASGLNFQLQESTDLSLPNSWSPVSQPAITNAGKISVTVPTTVGRKFFRLKSQ